MDGGGGNQMRTNLRRSKNMSGRREKRVFHFTTESSTT